ncbi:MAG: TVP38/TMEM64 family protein [Asticcacaulis sp.]|nr:TVP38/TMEM64 family protein [Asticcacaulis sp.]
MPPSQDLPQPLSPVVQWRRAAIALLAAIVAVGLGLVWQYRADLAHPHQLIAPFMAAEDAAPLRTALLFFAAYVLVTALSIPVEVLFALAAGALFGFVEGAVMASLASGLGAAIAFLISRHLLRDLVHRHLRRQLDWVDAGIRRDGAAFVFSLRLLPILPFGLINLVMGLTSMDVRRFYVVSQLGLLPATLLYVNAGTQLARVDSVSDIVSPSLILALVLIGAFPWIAKGGIALWRRRHP